MGNYQDRQAELQLYMEHEDGVYGRGTLYSSTKLPSCYLIKNVRLLADEQQFKLFSQIEDFQNVHLVGLYGYSFGKSCECDSRGVCSRVVVSYWEFLSFSLRDCIAYRKRIGVMFHEHEVWHIIKACVNGYLAFERLNVYYEFIEDYILLNQEGKVRLSWNHVEPKNQHLRYYKLEREFHAALKEFDS